MSGLKEIGFALGRIVFGMVILIGWLITLVLINHLSDTGSTRGEQITAAYGDGYDQGYVQTYEGGYQKAYDEAYAKGYNKGYEIGLGSGSRERVATLVEFRNPTYRELKEFLASDKTDSNPYISGDYVCFEFATQVNNNAEAIGIRAAYVRIRFKEWAHAVVAFETVDRGLVFIEPQSDKDVELVIGKPYPWRSSGATRTTKYDDAIIEIQLIW